MKLRLSPVNGDTLHADVGGKATQASGKVEGKDFETAELKVSFLAVDSTGEHEIGEPVEWQGRITLQSRDYPDGDRRMVELHAAPPAPIRYSTDGSDPKVAGVAPMMDRSRSPTAPVWCLPARRRTASSLSCIGARSPSSR